MISPKNFETIITQALTDAGGPPELAPQLVAMARERNATRTLIFWINFHLGEEWSALQFSAWLTKYEELEARIFPQEEQK